MRVSEFSVSLDMINRHYSEPNRNRYESKYYWEELYTLINAAGFGSIEIPFEPVWQFGGRSGVPLTPYCVNTKYGDLSAYRAFLQSCGISKVTAVTFDPSLFARNDQMGFYFGATKHFALQAIDFAAGLGAKYLVLSPSASIGRLTHYHPGLIANKAPFVEELSKVVAEIAAVAASKEVKLLLRPEYWSVLSLDETLDLVKASSGHLGIAFNAAHLHLADSDVLSFLEQHCDLIDYVQLSDTKHSSAASFKTDANPAFPSHKATQVFCDVGTGVLPLTSILTKLTSLKYSGHIVLCNHQTRDPNRALLRNRRFINQISPFAPEVHYV